MSEEQKKATVKAIAKNEIAVKPVKHVLAKHVPAKVPAKRIPAKQVPAVHVLTTFDDLMDNFRKNFIESIAFPFEWINIEPVVPVREATVDLVDEGNKFVVHAEMPGVAKDKIDVALTKDGIEISAETDVETEDTEKNFVVRERVYSHIYKQLSFPEEVIPEKAESTFRDGLLAVSIPKKTVAPAPKKHKVTVK
ncbi:MAG: Hsp20/alpha crystallin family protein [Candidatus Bathyarchaeia archaeon]|jgi:HSP20 family protein